MAAMDRAKVVLVEHPGYMQHVWLNSKLLFHQLPFVQRTFVENADGLRAIVRACSALRNSAFSEVLKQSRQRQLLHCSPAAQQTQYNFTHLGLVVVCGGVRCQASPVPLIFHACTLVSFTWEAWRDVCSISYTCSCKVPLQSAVLLMMPSLPTQSGLLYPHNTNFTPLGEYLYRHTTTSSSLTWSSFSVFIHNHPRMPICSPLNACSCTCGRCPQRLQTCAERLGQLKEKGTAAKPNFHLRLKEPGAPNKVQIYKP